MYEMEAENLLEVKNLKKYFPVEEGFFRRVTGYVKAVDDINFSIKQGKTMGLVGESGCGKTTTARTIIRAMEPTDGQVLYRTEADNIVDIAQLNKNELDKVHNEMQMIFQDPFSSLNPRLSVLKIIAEPLITQGWKKKKYTERVNELLDLVGLDATARSRFPHAFSGGQRQRIGVARALSIEPSMIIADEPVSALDVSVQAQILNLLVELQQKLDLTFLFIAHDLSVVRYTCEKVAVMYLGKLVEITGTETLYNNPLHPYTSALLSSVPDPDKEQKWLENNLEGEVPDPSEDIPGCNFASRCRYAEKQCQEEEQELRELNQGDTSHLVACRRAEELDLQGVV